MFEAIKHRHGEQVASMIFAYLRSPRLGYYIGAKIDCSAALRFDMIQSGIVDNNGGLTEKGLKISCLLRS